MAARRSSSSSNTCNTQRRRRRRHFHSAAAAVAVAASAAWYLLVALSSTTADAAAAATASTANQNTNVLVLRGSNRRRTQNNDNSDNFVGRGRNRLFQEGLVVTKRKTDNGNKKEKEPKTPVIAGAGGLNRASLYNKCKKPKAGKLPPKNPVKGASAVGGSSSSSSEDTASDSGGNQVVAISETRQIDPNTGEEVIIASTTTTGANDLSDSFSEEEYETETICDENGNLLAGFNSYAPTMAPGMYNETNSRDDTGDITDELSKSDTDNDGLTYSQELFYGTDPDKFDTDGDGLSDGQEVFLGTDPLKMDTDGDGYSDYQEKVVDDTDPLDETDFLKPDVVDSQGMADNDADGLTNVEEIKLGTDINNPDTDGDGFTDGMEVNTQKTDPLKADTDADGLTDYAEVMDHGTLPLKNDTDGDGLSDGWEVANGYDPLVDNTGYSDPAAFSPGCAAWRKEEVYKTKIPARVNFIYEVAIDDEASVAEVNQRMEGTMSKLVGRELIKCGLLRRLEYEQSSGHHGRHLSVDGIDPNPQDIVTQKTCTYYTADNPETPARSKCYVIQGLMTLYLRENSVVSSTSESSSKALRTLLNAMNKADPSPFVEFNNNNEFSVRGVRAVRYVKGTPDEGGMLLIDNSGGLDVGKDGNEVGGATKSSWDVDPLSPIGISLIAIGAAAILGVALVGARGMRKRKRTNESPLAYAEFWDDDDNDLDLKHHGFVGGVDGMTDMDASSLEGDSPARNKKMNYDEGDSIFSGLELTPGNESMEPAFVHTHRRYAGGDDAVSIAVTAEHGYEVGEHNLPPSSPGVYNLQPPSALSTPRSLPSPGFEPFPEGEYPRYEPKVPLERPTYEHPSGMRQSPERNGRVYYVGDTVEF